MPWPDSLQLVNFKEPATAVHVIGAGHDQSSEFRSAQKRSLKQSVGHGACVRLHMQSLTMCTSANYHLLASYLYIRSYAVHRGHIGRISSASSRSEK